MDKSTTCSVDGCNNAYCAKGFCKVHYSRLSRTGSTEKSPMYDPERRFWLKVVKTDGCWEWTGNKSSAGYGRARAGDGNRRAAHRVSWESINGSIPEGMFLDHRCHNRACVNPTHLRLATNKQNSENRAGPSLANKNSGVRGVYKSGDRWYARLGHNGVRVHLGTYDTIEEAAAVVAEARRKLFTHSQD